MPEMTEPYYVSMLKGHGFTPDPDDHQYGALGLCWKISQEIGEGSYWTYGQKDLYDIKIHNFSFHKDSLLEFSLPECLSITRYDSISGEELSPYRRLSAGCIKTYIGGYEPYQVLIHKNIPIRSIGIEIMPAYYEDYLKKQYPEEYRNPVEAFRKIDQTTDFPEMSRLLSESRTIAGMGSPPSCSMRARWRRPCPWWWSTRKNVQRPPSNCLRRIWSASRPWPPI